ncbi:MAG: arylesterase [Gemmatimonadales bacterium]
MRGVQPASGPAGTADTRPVILFLGTSLTAGLGLDPSDAYPAAIQRRIDSAGMALRAVNAGLSGETSAGASRRIGWILEHTHVALLVIETGANDGLRGQDPDSVAANIREIIALARRQHPEPRISLIQMYALPNYGRAYGERFAELYPRVARQERVTLLPFLLAGVAGVDSLDQADGIHPDLEGERIVTDNVWRALRPLLDSLTRGVGRRASGG